MCHEETVATHGTEFASNLTVQWKKSSEENENGRTPSGDNRAIRKERGDVDCVGGGNGGSDGAAFSAAARAAASAPSRSGNCLRFRASEAVLVGPARESLGH